MKKSAFSIIEMLVVMAIICVLVTLTYPAEIWTLICARPTGGPHAHFEYFSDVLWLDGHVGAFEQEIE